jgi:endogenous inhibitor of DNA gyrase (YacG/DUF329 family)
VATVYNAIITMKYNVDYGIAYVEDATCAECGKNLPHDFPVRFYKGKPYCGLKCLDIGMADEMATEEPIKKSTKGK